MAPPICKPQTADALGGLPKGAAMGEFEGQVRRDPAGFAPNAPAEQRGYAAVPALSGGAANSAPGGSQTFCYACGSQVDARAAICTACGVAQKQETQRQAHPMAVPGLILNIFFPGVGTLVIGQMTAGIIQLVLLVISIPLMFILIGFPIGFAAWVWALVVSIQSFSDHKKI